MRNTRISTVENQISKLQLQNNKERKQHSDLLNKWLGLDGALGSIILLTNYLLEENIPILGHLTMWIIMIFRIHIN